jgi:hypothetical protein
MTSFRLPACATWHGGGDLTRYNLDVGGEMRGHGPPSKDLGGGRQHAELWLAHQKADLFIAFSSSFGPDRCMWRDAPPGSLRQKVNGGLTTGTCWAPWRFTRMKVLFNWTLDLQLGGPRGTGRGACTWRLNTGPPMGSQKWMGATWQECTEPTGSSPG